MKRRWVWLQIALGWLPIAALFATMVVAMHGGSILQASRVAVRMMVSAAALGWVVQRMIERIPWPRPLRVSFVLIHAGLALAYAAAWLTLDVIIETIIVGGLGHHVLVIPGPGAIPFLITGVWMYIMVAGVSYATFHAERTALAEANAARAQLAALRAQLDPHFLFNALHTVVHLIPREPERAARAAERLSELLRTAIEEDRDLVPLSREAEFVGRYLELEQLRFGDRLRARIDIAPDATTALVPSFALQSLVENSVRHGAEPKVDATDVEVTARVEGATLLLMVRDTGVGLNGMNGTGTGLRRLRERLTVLFGGAAALDLAANPTGGCIASLRLPLTRDE